MIAFSDWRPDFGMSPSLPTDKGQTPGPDPCVSSVRTAPKYNSGLLFTSVKYLDTCCDGARVVVQRPKKGSEVLSRSEGEAVALTVKNNVYFVIFTILEFVALLILLNDIVASPL